MSVITDDMVQRAYAFYEGDIQAVDDWMHGVLEAGCGSEIERLRAENEQLKARLGGKWVPWDSRKPGSWSPVPPNPTTARKP